MMHFLPEPEIELRLRIHASGGGKPRTAAQHMVNEFKLHKDQQIDWDEDGKSFVLAATVTPSGILRQFPHSQSDSIEVPPPAGMRAKFAERVRRMADRYAQETGPTLDELAPQPNTTECCRTDGAASNAMDARTRAASSSLRKFNLSLPEIRTLRIR
ncbi:hypothetical protein R69608_07027 [Paraburkholderia nemoris]|nr:hypothetical protein R69608_07027 [Paraburkholderia nemoris]